MKYVKNESLAADSLGTSRPIATPSSNRNTNTNVVGFKLPSSLSSSARCNAIDLDSDGESSDGNSESSILHLTEEVLLQFQKKTIKVLVDLDEKQ